MATIQNIPGNEAPATSRAKINSNFTAVNDEVVAATSAVAGKENSGTAAAAVAAHVAAGDPHTQYAPKADAPLTGNTTFERMSALIHDHGNVASGTLTLHAVRAVQKATLTGTSMTVAFPAGDPRVQQVLFLVSTNGSDGTVAIPSSRSFNQGAVIDSITVPGNGAVCLTWFHDGSTYWLLGDYVSPAQLKTILAIGLSDVVGLVAALAAKASTAYVDAAVAGAGGGVPEGITALWPRASAGSIPAGWREDGVEADIGGKMQIVRDTAAPTFSSATIPPSGNVINLTFSKAVKFGAGGNGGFTIAMSGGAVTMTYSSGANTSTLVYSLSRTISSGETCSDFDYTQPGNGVESGAGIDLATFTNQQASVANTVSFTPNTALMSSGNYARRTTAPTGLADATTYTLSCFLEFTGGDGVDQTMFDISNGTAAKLRLRKTTSNLLTFDTWSPGGSPIATMTTSGAITVASGRIHVYVAVNQTNTALCKFYVNGTNVRTDGSIANPAACDLVPSTPKYSFARDGSDSNPASVRLSEFWFDDVYLDSPSLFATGSTPVDIGATGNTPTGSAPAFYFSRSGSGNSWATDSSGNGNDLTVTGTLGT